MNPESVQPASRPYKVIGTRPVRHDGADKVTGKAQYTADLLPANTAHAKILRSPHAHAKIVSIDTSQAEALPGVVAVATAADFPDLEDKIADLGEGAVSLADLGANVLAMDKVLYKGHAVAAVAAVNQHVAQQAVELIDVQYEPLPAVTWVLDAMRDDSPLLHPELYTDEMGKKATTPSNVSTHLHFEKGDAEVGFAEADLVLEREFKTASVHQGYIEPHVAVADWINPRSGERGYENYLAKETRRADHLFWLRRVSSWSQSIPSLQ